MDISFQQSVSLQLKHAGKTTQLSDNSVHEYQFKFGSNHRCHHQCKSSIGKLSDRAQYGVCIRQRTHIAYYVVILYLNVKYFNRVIMDHITTMF